MSDNHEEQKTSAQIEREIEVQRSRVSSTIDEIQDQLSPGQLFDQVMSMTKSSGGDFAKNLGGAISSNPLPVALLGASLLWLISGAGASHQSSGPSSRPAPTGYRNGDSDALRNETYSGYRGDHLSPLDKAKAAGSGLVDKVHDVADRVGGTIGDTVGEIGHSAEHLGGQVADLADQAGHALHDARDQAARVTSSLTHALENQPLVAGALAFAAGAALGAIVPRTPQEDEFMGATADKVKSAVKEAAEPIIEEGKHLFDEGKDKLDEGRAALEKGVAGASDALGKAVGDIKKGAAGATTT